MPITATISEVSAVVVESVNDPYSSGDACTAFSSLEKSQLEISSKYGCGDNLSKNILTVILDKVEQHDAS